MVELLALVLILGLAVYRLSRLWIEDKIFEGLRGRFNLLTAGRGRFLRWVNALANCGWCLSVWWAGIAVLSVDLLGYSVPFPFFTWMAVAAAAVGFWQRFEP